jgi:hypothetical protein
MFSGAKEPVAASREESENFETAAIIPGLASSTSVWMLFYQLVQVFADVPPTLGTLHRSWSFFVHQDTASRTKPLATETVAFLGKSEVFRLLGLTHEPRVRAEKTH